MATSLPYNQVQMLAGAGEMMLYIVNNMTGISNLTSVQMADFLLDSLKSNASQIPVTQVVGMVTRNQSATPADAEHFLSMYDLMPTDAKHGRAIFWVAMFIVSGFVLALRFFTRLRLAGGLKKDDWVLLAAWIVATGLNIEEIYRIFVANWEHHYWFLTLDQIKIHGLLGTIDTYLFFLASALYKMSLLMFFQDLSRSRTYRYCGFALIGLVWIYSGLCMVYLGVMCSPIDTWNHPFTVKCYEHGREVFIAIMCCNMVVDTLILALPLSIVYNLQLRKAEKAMVISLILLGSFVCICSVMRITCVDPYLHNADRTWANLPLTDWTVLEVHLGIVCASAPMLRKLLLHVVPKLESSFSSSTNAMSSGPSSSSKSSSAAKSMASHVGILSQKPGSRSSEEDHDDKKIFTNVQETGLEQHRSRVSDGDQEVVRYHYSFDEPRASRNSRDVETGQL